MRCVKSHNAFTQTEKLKRVAAIKADCEDRGEKPCTSVVGRELEREHVVIDGEVE